MVVVGIVVVVVALTRSPAPAPSPPAKPTQPKACTNCAPNVTRFFAPTSIWNSPVPADAPLDPNSAQIVSTLHQMVATGPLGIATVQYGTPIYTVPGNELTVHVTLDDNPDSHSLQRAFDAVPIPPTARPAPGTDGYLVIYQPSSDTMWEFWKASMQPDGWHAVWGGRILHVSRDPGYYRVVRSPSGEVLERQSWGAPATSLPLAGGTMQIAELRAGNIDHALSLSLAETRAHEWAWPAQRTDGQSTDPYSVPEGAHFRLDPHLNLAALHLPHFTLMMAEAAQKYGIIVTDRTEGVLFHAEDPSQWEALHGYNPYLGPEGKPGTPGALYDLPAPELVAAFPWSHLELLKMDLRNEPDVSPVVETPPPGTR